MRTVPTVPATWRYVQNYYGNNNGWRQDRGIAWTNILLGFIEFVIFCVVTYNYQLQQCHWANVAARVDKRSLIYSWQQPNWSGHKWKVHTARFTYQAKDAPGISVLCIVVQVYCNDIGQYVVLKHLNSARGWLACIPEIIWIPTNNDELVVGVDNIAPVSLVE